jgi:hypothetical protein
MGKSIGFCPFLFAKSSELKRMFSVLEKSLPLSICLPAFLSVNNEMFEERLPGNLQH